MAGSLILDFEFDYPLELSLDRHLKLVKVNNREVGQVLLVQFLQGGLETYYEVPRKKSHYIVSVF